MTVLPFSTPAEIQAALPLVTRHLAADRILAYPTETVYGFGGAISSGAVAALGDLKRREPADAFLMLIDGPGRVPAAQWSAAARTLADLFWPGPLTIVLPSSAEAYPPGVLGAGNTVAVRASPHPAVAALLAAWSAPITSSSANARGRPPARDAVAVVAALEELDSHDVLVLDGGPLKPSLPSTIVACSGSMVRVLREGAIVREQLIHGLEGTGMDVS